MWTLSGDEFFRAEDDAAEAAALAVDVLGRRIDDAVGAELERLLEQRRREHVVDHERGAGVVRDLGDRRDVDAPRASGWSAFQKERLGVRAAPPCARLEIGAVDQRRGDAVARQVLLDDVEAGAEQRLRGDDVVAGAHLAHQRGGDRRHAGCGRARRLGAFERAPCAARTW